MGGSNREKLNRSSHRPPRGSSSLPSTRHGLFVERGVLSDWSAVNSPPSRGKKSNIGGTGSSKPDSKLGDRGNSNRSRGNAIGYAYPTEDTHLHVGLNQENEVDTSTPMVLIDSEKTQIVDKGAIGESRSVEYIYDYTTSFTLDHSSHRGLGFNEYAETTPCGFGSSFKIEEEDGDSIVFFSCEANHLGGDTDLINDTKAKIGEDSLEEMPSPEENPCDVLIGGTKIYTYDTEEEQELTDVERSEEEEEDKEEEDCSATSESDVSLSVTYSDIDEEVAVDYFEGIGGIGDITNVDQLVGKVSDVSDDDNDFKDCYDETLQKFSGIALTEASRVYGQMKPGSGIKYLAEDKKLTPIKYAGSPTLDDLILVKDPRTASERKKHHDKISQSQPFESHKSKKFGKIPGEKKKHCKETIAAKRRERMMNRGLDLQHINSKLQQMVLHGVKIRSFHPMHPRDRSQVRRLASIYRLGSLCSGSGKKRYVTVIWTHQTCMPCSDDKVRLEKLIGVDKNDSDFPVVDTMTAQFHRDTAKKSFVVGASTSDGPRSSWARSNKLARNNKIARKVGSYASQPVSFVSSGMMNSETVDTEIISPETKDVSSSVEIGAFEMHTTGFGSKMLAKKLFVVGGGLGKDGQGVSHPIEVAQRSKSLGLGAEVPETSTSSVNIHAPSKPTRSSSKFSNANDKLAKKDSQKLASFEKHTKGFGSKMMAKMGFVEGMGLGKDGQGVSHPIEVTQRPKSLGLGAEVLETSTSSVNIHAPPKPTRSSVKFSNANGKLAKKDFPETSTSSVNIHAPPKPIRSSAKFSNSNGKLAKKDFPETSTSSVNIHAPPKPTRSSANFSNSNDKLAKKDFPETSTSSVNIHAPPKPTRSSTKFSNANGKLGKKVSQKLASFEKHTNGFGSKMMAKMGVVEGMGLGKDSQGMVKPLVAVWQPKALGLGAMGLGKDSQGMVKPLVAVWQPKALGLGAMG